ILYFLSASTLEGRHKLFFAACIYITRNCGFFQAKMHIFGLLNGEKMHVFGLLNALKMHIFG
ncbi:MAG: hypothetical protein IJR40_09460, partial [Treponema sp.]|nr:hypothetical protein [Treponema sp.]